MLSVFTHICSALLVVRIWCYRLHGSGSWFREAAWVLNPWCILWIKGYHPWFLCVCRAISITPFFLIQLSVCPVPSMLHILYPLSSVFTARAFRSAALNLLCNVGHSLALALPAPYTSDSNNHLTESCVWVEVCVRAGERVKCEGQGVLLQRKQVVCINSLSSLHQVKNNRILELSLHIKKWSNHFIMMRSFVF